MSAFIWGWSFSLSPSAQSEFIDEVILDRFPGFLPIWRCSAEDSENMGAGGLSNTPVILLYTKLLTWLDKIYDPSIDFPLPYTHPCAIDILDYQPDKIILIIFLLVCRVWIDSMWCQVQTMHLYISSRWTFTKR
jgi:hypothetical protein